MQDFSSGTNSSINELAPPRSRSIARGTTPSGDNYAPTLETSGTRSTGSSLQRAVRIADRPSTQHAIEPKVKHKARALFASCIENIERAIDNEADFFLRNNSLEQLKDSLGELWALRDRREAGFAEIVNMLQNILLGRDVEAFTIDQLDVLRSVFTKLHNEAVFDDGLANVVTHDLLKGDVDVFRELD